MGCVSVKTVFVRGDGKSGCKLRFSSPQDSNTILKFSSYGFTSLFWFCWVDIFLCDFFFLSRGCWFTSFIILQEISVSCSLVWQMISVPPEVANKRDVKQRSWSSVASPAHPLGYSREHFQAEAMATHTTIGRFSVVSTEDDVTQRTRCSCYSAPPDFYLDTPPSLTKGEFLPRAVTSNSVPVDVTVHARFLSSDSGAESSPAKLAPSTQSQQPRSERRGSDLMRRAMAFLRRTGRSSSVQSSDSPSRHGGIPGSAYASSDNDSEMEDSDIKRELQRLREKWEYSTDSKSLF